MTAPNRRFKLANYNVYNLGRKDYPEPRFYEAKLTCIANVLCRLDADLVAIEEVREPESFRELAEAVGLYPERFLADPPEEHRRIQTGILTRLPVLEHGQWFDFPAVLPGQTGEMVQLKFRRPVLWVRVRLPNKETLLVVAVHLKSRRPETEGIPETEPIRRQEVLGRALAVAGRTLEAAGLRCLLDSAMDLGAADHYVVLGDFNDSPDSEPVSLVMGIEDEVRDTADTQVRRLFPVAWWMSQERLFSFAGGGRRELLDQILVSQDLSLGLSRAGVESQLLEPTLGQRPEARRAYPGSDHAPVWAEFELSAKATGNSGR